MSGLMAGSDDLAQYHWWFDGVVAAPLRAPEIRKLLADVVRIIRMTPIAAPAIYVDTPRRWCGLQLIAESHVAIHGQSGSCAVDVFSCRPFDPQHVLACLAQWMPGRWVANWIERELSVWPEQTRLELVS